MKPDTKKRDGEIWKLWKGGMAPKDITAEMNVTASQVKMGLYRERRRRKVPLMESKRTRKTNKNKRKQR
jgi:hypothetical protein